jgi:hypothetical protein
MMRHGCDHAARTAADRYGLRLDEQDFAAMAADIILSATGERHSALLLRRHDLESEIWLVRVPEGPAVRVVYRPIVAMIITILPPWWRPRGSINAAA